MFIKINTKNKQKLAINKFFHLLPPVLLGFATLIFSITTLLFSQIKTFAAPGTPSGAPGILDFSVKPTIGLHFTSSEIQSNTFKSDTAVLWCDAPNPTGFSVFLSSIDEDTNLNHTDSSVVQKITSITSPSNSSSFNSKNWGYLANQSTYSGTFRPIPKASQPDQALNISLSETAKFFLHFGVKTGPDLPSGTYYKKILVTAITNYVPTSATFIPGPDVNNAIHNANIGHDVEFFKKSNVAPENLATATVVSTADSDLPIYLWYDQVQKTIFWWSNADTVYANEDSNLMLANINDNATLMQLIDMRGINTSRVKNMHHMFWTKDGLTKHINLDEFDTSNVEDMGYMFSTPYENNSTTAIDPIDFSRFDTRNLKIMPGMFAGSHLPSIDIRNFNTSNVTNMEHLFNGLKKVTDLDLSGLDVKRVNNIGSLFARNPGLISLNLSNWQLDSVHDMSYMFTQLYDLKTLNLTGFTTKNVVDMNHMFNGCQHLTSLDLSSFDTSQVTNMSTMFKDMGSLNNINLSSFNTSNVTDMSEMFSMTIVNPPISNLDLSSFNTSNVTDMHGMFQGMANLSNLNLQSFDTRNVTNMKAMFYWAFMYPENSILDLSSFDTRNVTDMGGMFFYSKLKTIYASPSFVTTSVTISPNDPFMSNPNLTGANGTTWDWSKRDRVYARIDTPGNPGFFTQKP